MEKNKKGINVSAPIVPYTDQDTYPTHEAIYGKGGWKSVRTIEDLKAIPKGRLEDGCIVRVVESSSSSGSAVEFYYDSSIKDGASIPSSITDPIEREVYPYKFRKWAPGYLPTKLSDLENDMAFIAEVHDTEENGDYTYLDPNNADDKNAIEKILVGRARGIYQELALAFLNKNSSTTVKVDTNEDGVVDGNDNSIPIHGLVTVDDTGKIPNDLLEYPGKYVESLVAMFPDDFCEDPLDPAAYFVYLNGKPSKIDSEGKPVTADTPNSFQSEALKWDHPQVTEKDQKYYISEYYKYKENNTVYNAYRNKVAVVTSSDPNDFSWTASDPIWNDIIYVDEFRRTAFIVKNDGIIVEKSIGRDLIRTIEELMRPATILEVPTEWDNWGISAKVAYQILLEIDKIVAWGEDISEERNKRKEADEAINKRIDDLWDKLNAHIQDKNNPHNVTREQLGVGESDEVTFSKVTANGFFMSVGSAGKMALEGIMMSDISADEETHEEEVISAVSEKTSSAQLLTPRVRISSSSNPSLRVGPSDGTYDWQEELENEREEREAADAELNKRIDEVEAAMNAHIARRDNPHETNRGHLKIDTTDAVIFSKVNAPNGFFQANGKAAVFKVATPDPEEEKLNELESKIKELEAEIAKLRKV
jgi:hypothetical protein